MRFPKMIIKNSTQQFIISNILEHALSWKKVTFGKIAWQDSQGKVTFGNSSNLMTTVKNISNYNRFPLKKQK